jgi:hypothetical protein
MQAESMWTHVQCIVVLLAAVCWPLPTWEMFQLHVALCHAQADDMPPVAFWAVKYGAPPLAPHLLASASSAAGETNMGDLGHHGKRRMQTERSCQDERMRKCVAEGLHATAAVWLSKPAR